jgi:hypothetical protein
MNGMSSSRQQSTDDFDAQRVHQSSDSKQQEREQLYEAYNLLHTLAQVLKLNVPSLPKLCELKLTVHCRISANLSILLLFL